MKTPTGTGVYLRRGLNEIETDEAADFKILTDAVPGFSEKITATQMNLDGKARLETDKYGISYIDGISSEGGDATFTVNAPESGTYRVTLNYANNLEGGYHAYNVDLIEALLTVSANGQAQDIFCRNTSTLKRLQIRISRTLHTVHHDCE